MQQAASMACCTTCMQGNIQATFGTTGMQQRVYVSNGSAELLRCAVSFCLSIAALACTQRIAAAYFWLSHR